MSRHRTRRDGHAPFFDVARADPGDEVSGTRAELRCPMTHTDLDIWPIGIDPDGIPDRDWIGVLLVWPVPRELISDEGLEAYFRRPIWRWSENDEEALKTPG